MHPADAVAAAELRQRAPDLNNRTDLSLIGQVCFFARTKQERNCNACKI